ncbi:MAG: TAG lipase/steryl ester hydrolase/phospholipase A2/LPA acyltransferase, partial [Myxococcota bacterium]
GDIDIHPRLDVRVYGKLLSNPTAKDLAWFISEGERATWPKLNMIGDATRISRCLARCEATLARETDA